MKQMKRMKFKKEKKIKRRGLAWHKWTRFLITVPWRYQMHEGEHEAQHRFGTL